MKNFGKLADAFYIVERKARQEIEDRNKIQKTMAYKEYLKQEERMREAAANARVEKIKIQESNAAWGDDDNKGKRRNPYVEPEEDEGKKERDMFRYINKREIERDRRLEVARSKKSKSVRDGERDISEKIALGQAQPTATQETMYDQRLFNQTSGLDTGFGDEDEYGVYDKPLFQDKAAASIYNIKEYDDNIDEADTGEKEKKKTGVETGTTKAPQRGFDGAEKKAARTKPVEFEKHDEEDLFGLGKFIGDGGSKKMKYD